MLVAQSSRQAFRMRFVRLLEALRGRIAVQCLPARISCRQVLCGVKNGVSVIMTLIRCEVCLVLTRRRGVASRNKRNVRKHDHNRGVKNESNSETSL